MEQDDSFAFYKISFQWYAVIGVITTWIPGMIISHLTGGQNFNGFNVQLLSPAVRHLVPMKYRHTELKTVKNVNEHIEEKIKEHNEKSEMSELITQKDKINTQTH